MQSLFQIEIIYKPAKDETIIFSRSAPSRRKEVPFEPDKTPVPTDLYIAGGRAVGADRAESECSPGGRAGCRGAELVRIRLDACLD